MIDWWNIEILIIVLYALKDKIYIHIVSEFLNLFKGFQHKTSKNILMKDISTSQFHLTHDCPFTENKKQNQFKL